MISTFDFLSKNIIILVKEIFLILIQLIQEYFYLILKSTYEKIFFIS
jgi:hypothetical protein